MVELILKSNNDLIWYIFHRWPFRIEKLVEITVSFSHTLLQWSARYFESVNPKSQN